MEDSEIFGTGGGFYNYICKVSDGWVFGECNGWGGVFQTREHAESDDPDYMDSGFIRNIESIEEQAEILRKVYQAEIDRNGYYSEYCKEWMQTIEDDLREGV